MVADSLREANADDWLLLSGAISIGVVAAIILSLRFGVVNLLVFDKKTGSYNELILNSQNLLGLLEVVHDGKDYKEEGRVE